MTTDRAVRAVVFDLDATLVDHVGAATAALRSWLGARGVGSSTELESRWFALEEEHFTRWRDGEISHDEQRRERLRAFLPLVGARAGTPAGTPAELDAVFAGFLAEHRRHWRAFDDAAEVLAALHACGLLTAVLTNGVEELQREKLVSVGLVEAAGPLFAADALGVAKPRPGAFTAVCEHLGRCRSRCSTSGTTTRWTCSVPARRGCRPCWSTGWGRRRRASAARWPRSPRCWTCPRCGQR
ncbi:HAD family hydrolase [Quadrisphaera sp. RL12-1S]|nr:HAD family hydrolase [Quadrisphaera sp. RL12-1S]